MKAANIRCVYDNPVKFRREVYVNGVLRGFITQHRMLAKGFAWRHVQPPELRILNVGPWRDGKVVGDPKAMTHNPHNTQKSE